MSIRINKFFTEQGYCSRRDADKLIAEKRVQINGRVAVLGDKVEIGDKVFLDGKEIQFSPIRTYIMYNKPRGITCTTDLKIKGNIIDAIKYPSRIFPIGRLDKDSSGLIFLTNDGNIVNQILRAQFGHEKEYEVELHQIFDDDFIKLMSKGVNIGDHVTLPCKVKRMNPKTFSIILTEGKNRQIRRMCEALKSKVKTLKRVRIMNVNLGQLSEGSWQNVPERDLIELKFLLNNKNLL